ncbi:MAG: O-acetylhomoserine aminocarboxypropyltransferase/cysteine synthase [Lachnospiraceae bacterium]|nr:O-acetylhomoserine aminocarboxypropyltransferase/cysteine synthase [Lachnospiraceae bacterium]
MEFNTKLLHGRSVTGYADNSILPQIAQVTAFAYESAQAQEKVFAHQANGFAYTRIGNPTIAAFEQRMAELEGGMSAIACSSGMAAISMGLLNFLSAGDEIIAASGLYGGTIDLFSDLEKLGIHVNYVEKLIPEEIHKYTNKHTKVIYGEFISNPGLSVLDIPSLAEYAHSIGVPLVIDATTVTPYVANPISLGADIVIHSTSKYVNGSGNSISGVIVDSGKFPWDFDKYPALSDFRKYGKLCYSIRLRTDLWENFGGCLSPMNAYLNVLGLETLGLRMERINRNAKELAAALAELEGVTVRHPSLPTHENADLVQEELKGYGGGILTLRVGSKENAFSVINSLKLATIASNIGDIRTLVLHPASTIFSKNGKEAREKAGVFDDTIRVSVGIEDAKDLIEDFTQAIEAVVNKK